MNRIRDTRKARGLTLKNVADSVGCSIAYLSDLEQGRRGARQETLDRIADVLGVTTDDLMGGGDDETPDD